MFWHPMYARNAYQEKGLLPEYDRDPKSVRKPDYKDKGKIQKAGFKMWFCHFDFYFLNFAC